MGAFLLPSKERMDIWDVQKPKGPPNVPSQRGTPLRHSLSLPAPTSCSLSRVTPGATLACTRRAQATSGQQARPLPV